MKPMTRRQYLKTSALATLAGMSMAVSPGTAEPEARPKRKFAICLSCGPIGVPGDPKRAIEWATQYGYEAIEPAPEFLGKLSDAECADYVGAMKAAKLVWGAAGFPVQFRGDAAAFEQSMKSLPAFCRSLQRAGVTRTATWLTPGSRSVTYMANFRLHARRLRESAKVLGDHGLRLGLEYVGPKTSWSTSRYPFIHTMAEMKDLIAEIGGNNVGFLLDSWHWYTAQETGPDLLSLKAGDVVLCHLNDAPAGVPVDQQIDSKRDLPCATGVIDVKTFLGTMIKIGYDGPVVCEPFSQELRKMTTGQALSTVAAAVKKAVALAESQT